MNVSSRAWPGWWGQVCYASSKGGAVWGTRALAVAVAAHRISVNSVTPALIETPLLRREPAAVVERMRAASPSGVICDADDVARAVAFLVSSRAPTVARLVMYMCGGKSRYALPGMRTT